MLDSDFSSRISLSVVASAEDIGKIGDLGLRYVELGPLEEHGSAPTQGVDSRRIANIGAALRSAGVQPASMHAPFRGEYDFGSLDEGTRERAIGLQLRQLRYCSDLGVGCYVVHPGGLMYGRWDEERKKGIWPHDHGFSERLWKINVGVLSTIGDAAQYFNVRVCLENGWFDDPNFMTVEDFMGILRGADHGNLGACIDTGHANFGLVLSPSDLLRRVWPLVWAVHLHDNDGRGDQHLPPGSGNIQWNGVVGALRDIAYKGTLNLELNAGTNPAEGVASLKRILSGV